MTHSATRIYFLFLLSCFTLYAYSQCCPFIEKVGTNDQYLYDLDNIELDIYTDPNDDWLKYMGGTSAPQTWTYNKFIRLRAWSDRAENKHNYIQLYWWIGNGTNSSFTQTYANGIGPKAGTYTPVRPMVGQYGHNIYDYIYYWTHTDLPTNQPTLLGYRTHDFYYEDMGVVWVSPFSSYATDAGDLSNNNTKYVEGTAATAHITYFNSFTIIVDVDDDGNIYVQIGDQDCNKKPVVTIGRKNHIDVYRLNIASEGNGTVSVTPYPECEIYPKGEDITLTPSPANSSVCFKGWEGKDKDLLTDNGDGTFSITMPAEDINLTAVFGDCAKEVTDYIDTCAAALPFTWRPWSNGGKGYEITSAEQAKTIKDEVKSNGSTILEDSIVTLNLTLHEPQKVPVEVKDTFWQCDYDLGEDNWINLVVDDYELGEIELDIPNAIGTTYKTLDQDIYGCDSITIHEVIIIPEKVQRLFEFCQSDLSLGDNNYINIEIEPRLILEGTFWGNFSGDSIIRDTTQSVYCFGFDSITIDTIRIYPAYRVPWSPGLCADEMKDALADGIPFYDLGPVTDWSQNGLEYYTEGSIHGCDSIIVLNLTPIPNDTIDEHVQIPAFPYTFRGVTFNSIEDTLFIKTPQEPCNIYTKLIPDYIDTLKTEVYKLACMEFTWDENGKTYTDSGTDTVFLRSFDDKLDSIVVLHLTIDQPKIGIDTTATACESFTWYGTTYTETGDHTKALKSAAGCDSTVTLHLTVYSPQVTPVYQTACEEYEWYGTTYTRSGEYEHEFPINEHGCIDKEILYLTIGTTPAPVDLGEQIIGIGNAFTVFEGTPYQQSFDTDGKHTATGRTVLGCDSVVELTLVVLTTLEEDVYDTICQGEKYEWNGIEYTESGDYDYETVSVIGVDSIAHLHLTVNLPSSSETTAASCAPYTWFGQNYYESGDQKYHLTNAAGCDSTITLHLTIYPDYKNVQDGVTICPDQLPYTVNGVTFTQADAYTTVSNHYKQATKTMNLTTVNGCDSIVHFTLTVQTPTDEQQTETACDNQLPYRWNPTESYTQDLSEGGTFNYTLKSSLGCDSIRYTLNLTIDRDYLQAVPALTFETCANDEALQIALNHTVGTPAAYDITFDDRATAQGLANISHEDMPNDYVIAVPLPRNEDSTRYVRPDDYSLTLTVYDQCDRQTDYPLGFRILYPSWLIQQRWRDVLALYNDKYNGGYNFASIRWYKNGVEIQGRGAHNSYVQMTPVLEMATYYALLTRADDGKALRTCDFVPNLASPYYAPDVEKIRLVQQSDARHITVQTELSGEYIVYDVTGKQIMTGCFGQAYGNPAIVFSPALADGAYIIHFHANDGTEDTKKWLIH